MRMREVLQLLGWWEEKEEEKKKKEKKRKKVRFLLHPILSSFNDYIQVDCNGIKLDDSGGYVDKSKVESKSVPQLPITLFVTLDIKPEKVTEFLEIAKEDAEGSRGEEGCLK